ncbi:MAG: TIGR01777 family oxidoreductase [Flavobacteriaceae bacterium]
MKVLITGATGLVGKSIAEILLDKGVAVNYLTTRSEKIVSSKDFKGFYWNPAKSEIDLACFDGVSAVINLAGASIAKRWTEAYKEEVLSSRVNSLETLYNGLNEIDPSNIKTFVSASAVGIYPSSALQLYDEKETAVDDSFLGRVVKAWENKIDTFNAFDFNLAKIRVGIVMAVNGGALPKMAKPIRYYMGAILGNGSQWQSWIHINDLAQMFVFVVENNLKGTFNGVAPNPVTGAKMTKALAKTLKRPLWLLKIPQFAMQTVLGEMSYLLFASQRVSSRRIEKKGFIFQYGNIGPALENLFLTKKKELDNKTEGLNKELV